MNSETERPTSQASEVGPDTSTTAVSQSGSDVAKNNQLASLLRQRAKNALRTASIESTADNIRRQLQCLQHQRPFVLQCMLEPFEGETWKPFMSGLCDSPDMALRLVREQEAKQSRRGKRCIGFFIVPNETTEQHQEALQLGQWVPTSKKRGTSTTDADIEARLAMFVDFDPIREAFDDAGVEIEVNSTDAQLSIALKAALDCLELLTAIMQLLGIDPGCMSLACSGNGMHLIIWLDRLPKDPVVTQLVRDILYALAQRYDVPEVLEVDKSVSDAKRICPLYGTMKRKAPHTTATPQRKTFVTESSGARLSLAQLQMLRDQLCPHNKVAGLLESEPPIAALTEPCTFEEDDGSAVLANATKTIAAAPAGQRHATVLRTAFNVAGYVAGGALHDCLPALLEVCPDEHRRACEDAYRAGLQKPRHLSVHADNEGDDLAFDDEPPLVALEPAAPKLRYETTNGIPYCVVERLADQPLPQQSTPQPESWKPLQPLARTERPLPRFPTHVLPTTLRVWVHEQSCMLQQPYDIAATLGLATMATALQRTHEICVHRDWQEEVSIYATAVAVSGSNKSQIQSAATQPIRIYQQKLQEDYGRKLAAHKIRRKTLEHQLQTVCKDADEETKIELQYQLDRMDQHQPRKPQLVTADATQESLIDVLSAQGGSIGILTPEGKQIYSMITGRYGNQGDCKIELLLLGSSGETYTGNRRNKEQSYVDIPNVRITVGDSIQPEYVQRMIANGELRHSGLMGRYLISYPQSTLGWRDTTVRPMRDGVQEAYDNTVGTVLSGQPAPEGLHVIKVSDEAVRELERYRASFERFLREGGRYEEMTSWMSKSCGFVLKLAALMQAFEHPTCPHRDPISVELIRRAIVLVDYFREHFLWLVLQAHSHEVRTGAEKLVQWARKTHAAARDGSAALTFRPREAQQRIRAVKDKADLELALEQLLDAGYIRRQQPQQKRVILEWNPAVFELTSERPDTLPEPSCEAIPTVAAPEQPAASCARLDSTDIPDFDAPHHEDSPEYARLMAADTSAPGQPVNVTTTTPDAEPETRSSCMVVPKPQPKAADSVETVDTSTPQSSATDTGDLCRGWRSKLTRQLKAEIYEAWENSGPERTVELLVGYHMREFKHSWASARGARETILYLGLPWTAALRRHGNKALEDLLTRPMPPAAGGNDAK
ncbi:MAG TPA: YfjI family protein [Polyangiales bacterium]|nr:YfjI family protein [Polyangiales bacterium]